MKQLLSVAKAGRMLGFSRYMMEKSIAAGDLEQVEVAGKLWIKRSSVIALAEKIGHVIEEADDDDE